MRQLDQIILKDDETDTGGINHVGETLLEFLETIGFEVEDKLAITIREVAQINIKLADCGIKKLELEDFLDNPNPQSNNTETSMKFDAGKTQYHLLVPSFVRRIAEILTYSATHKYKPNSWQGLPDAKNRYYDATMRHLNEWWEYGRIEDPEDKIHPLIHAACNLMFLVYLDEHKEK